VEVNRDPNHYAKGLLKNVTSLSGRFPKTADLAQPLKGPVGLAAGKFPDVEASPYSQKCQVFLKNKNFPLKNIGWKASRNFGKLRASATVCASPLS